MREAFSEVMAAEKKKLFDFCKKATVMKQIQIASSAKVLKKTVGGEITNK